MHDTNWHDKPANDNRWLLARSSGGGSSIGSAQTGSTGRNGTVTRAAGRTVDIAVLIAALLWQVSFIVLLFALL